MNPPYKLLIVEDDPETLAMLQQFFSLHGFKVTAVQWAKDALRQCRENPPDLILLDVNLPDVNGYEVFARLRRLSPTKHTPVIFLTEQQGRDDRLTGLELGAVDYITKPFDTEELLLRVRNTLRQTAQQLPVAITVLQADATVKAHLRPLLADGERAAVCLRLENLDSLSRVGGATTLNQILRALATALHQAAAERGGADSSVIHLSEAELALLTSPAQATDLQAEVTAQLRRALDPLLATPEGEAVEPALSLAIGLITTADLD
ncbi:MAG: response regulator transcription factor [Chloroflexota bacterium]